MKPVGYQDLSYTNFKVSIELLNSNWALKIRVRYRISDNAFEQSISGYETKQKKNKSQIANVSNITTRFDGSQKIIFSCRFGTGCLEF